jgi:MFS family permease
MGDPADATRANHPIAFAIPHRHHAPMTTPATPLPRDAAAPAPGARLALTLLLLINLFNYVDRYVLAQLISPIRAALLPNDPNSLQKMGWLMSAFMLTYMLVSPLFGWLGDRFSRWKLIGVGVILWSLASGASGLAAFYTMMLGTRIFIGIGEAAYGPVAPTVIADLYPVAVRGKVLAWFYAAIPCGSALGYLLGGFMLSHWRWAFFSVVPPGVALGIWCFIMPEPKRGLSDSVDAGPSKARAADYLMLLRTPSYVLDCIGMTLMTFAIGGIAVFMPTYLSEPVARGGRGLNGQSSAFIFAVILAVGGLAATLAGGKLGDLLRGRVRGAYFLVSAAGLLMGFPLLLAMLYTPFSLGLHVTIPSLFTLFISPSLHLFIPYAWILLALAVVCLSGLSATLAGGWLGDRLRPRFAGSYFLVSGAAMLCGFPFLLWMLNTGFPGVGIWVLVFVTCFCLFFNTGPANAILANVTHPSIRATAFAANILIIHAFGDVLSPPLIGWVADHQGLKTGFILVSVTMVAGGLVWLWGSKYLDRDTALAPTRLASAAAGGFPVIVPGGQT